METVELRKKWIRSIANVDDRFLRMIDALYKSYLNEKDLDVVEEMPEEYHKLIEKGLADIEAGRVRPHDKVMAEIKKRYNISN